MKKWLIEVGGETRVCDLVSAYVSVGQLQLRWNKREFMVHFEDKFNYFEAKDGIKLPVTIYNMKKTQYKHGFAVFRIPKSQN